MFEKPRKVKVFKRQVVGNKSEKVFEYEGLCHGISTEGDPDGMCPVAVVELPDGTMQTPFVGNVQFIEPMKG